jgi:hypothetical protein
VYEIAYFLDTLAADDSFWNSWREIHPPALRRLEAIAFRLARAWFGCRLAPVAAEAIDELDAGIQLWFEHYAAAPLEAQFHPNKDELWLQFELLDSPRDRARLFLRRLLPAKLPVAAANVYVPEDQLTWRMRLRGAVKYAGHVISRTWYHTRAVPPVIAHGLIWKSRATRLPAAFWRLLGCSLLYFLGMYQFALLYNLYLLDLGYRVNVLGLVAAQRAPDQLFRTVRKAEVYAPVRGGIQIPHLIGHGEQRLRWSPSVDGNRNDECQRVRPSRG